MKVAISADTAGNVYPHFGRAPEFLFITIENNKVVDKQVIQNPGHTVGSIPQFVHDQKASVMIAGGMGQRAIQFFNQFGIDVVVGITGNIDDVVDQLIKGTLKGGETLCNPGIGKGSGVEKIHTEADDNQTHHH